MAQIFESKIKSFLGLRQVSSGETRLKTGESPNMKNLKVTESFTLCQREGYEALSRLNKEGRGVTVFGNEVIAVAGESVYSYASGEIKEVGTLESVSGKVSFLEYKGSLYIFDSVKIKRYSDSKLSDITPYVPLVVISTDYLGSGVLFEDINLLTPQRRQSFTLSEGYTTLKLTEKNIDSVDEVRLYGELLKSSDYDIDLESGEVTLAKNKSNDTNAYEVTYTKAHGKENQIHSMRYAALWGGDNDSTVFLWGSSDTPSLYRYSSSHSGENSLDYFPELNVNRTLSGKKVTALIRHYDRLLIFTENEAYYSYIEVKSDSTGQNYFSYPLRTLNSRVGCRNYECALLADNTPITLSGNGLYRWVSTNLRDERNAEEFGERIRKGLEEFEEATLFDRSMKREIYIKSGNKIYVYNYLLDVFYYYEGICAESFAQDSFGKCYFITADGTLCRFTEEHTDMGEKIDFLWESGYENFLGLECKNIYSLEFEVLPLSSTSFDIIWASEESSGTKSVIELEYKVLDFKNIFFDLFSFKTAVTPVKLFKRVKLKRIRGFKIQIKGDSENSDFHLVSLTVNGKVTDSK